MPVFQKKRETLLKHTHFGIISSNCCSLVLPNFQERPTFLRLDGQVLKKPKYRGLFHRAFIGVSWSCSDRLENPQVISSYYKSEDLCPYSGHVVASFKTCLDFEVKPQNPQWIILVTFRKSYDCGSASLRLSGAMGCMPVFQEFDLKGGAEQKGDFGAKREAATSRMIHRVHREWEQAELWCFASDFCFIVMLSLETVARKDLAQLGKHFWGGVIHLHSILMHSIEIQMLLGKRIVTMDQSARC